MIVASEVTDVATWAGLLTGISGTVLAVVAIWFAAVVDKRSRETSDRTIQSTQKIESAVERISNDTGGLIRAAWERMLGNVDSGSKAPIGPDLDQVKSLAAGIAAELRADLSPQDEEAAEGVSGSAVELHRRSHESQSLETAPQVDEIVKRLERTLEAELERRNRTTDPVEEGIEILRSLPPLARGLLVAIANSGHLERREYSLLRRDPAMARALNDLRRAGMLVPLAGSNDEVVYWIPGDRLPALGAALLTTSPPPTKVAARIDTALAEVGHTARVQAFRERHSTERS